MAVASNASYMIKAMELIYKRVTAPSPLSQDDQTRHKAMISAYKLCRPKEGPDTLPAQFELDNQFCPVHQLSYVEQIEELSNIAEEVVDSQNNLSEEIKGAVSLIARLFESLSKRTTYFGLLNKLNLRTYRKDGIEQMFFTELAMWMAIDLPRYSLKDTKTIEMIERRIAYCETILTKVLQYNYDRGISNPKDTLRKVIKELKGISEKAKLFANAASFSDRLGLINKDITALIRRSFNILHLMLKDVDQREFQVNEFLNPDTGDEKNNRKFKATLLGQWLVETCNKLGITLNNYDAGIRVPAAEILNHLLFEPNSIRSIEQIGVHDFVSKEHPLSASYLERVAPGFLSLVVNLHRSILELNNIRQTLKTSTRIPVAYGEQWLFDKDNGKPIVDALLDALSVVTQRHEKALNDLWNDFYVTGYVPYEARVKLDRQSKLLLDIAEAAKCYDKTKNTITALITKMQGIRHYVDNVQANSDQSKAQRIEVVTSLYDFLSGVPGYERHKLDDLNRLKERLQAQDCLSAASAAAGSAAESARQSLDSTTPRLTPDMTARNLLCEAGDYSPEEIPPALLERVSRYYALLDSDCTSLQIAACQASKDDALAQAAQHKLRKETRCAAIAALCQKGGYTEEQVPPEAIDAVSNFLFESSAASATPEEVQHLKETSEEAFYQAQLHKDTLLGATDMPTGETYKYTDMAVAVQVQGILNKPLDHEDNILQELNVLKAHQKRFTGMARFIYDELLYGREHIVNSRFFSLFRGYSDEQHKNLKLHFARMIRILTVISNGDQGDHWSAQKAIIEQLLRMAATSMIDDVDLKVSSKFFIVSKEPLISVNMEKNTVQIHTDRDRVEALIVHSKEIERIRAETIRLADSVDRHADNVDKIAASMQISMAHTHEIATDILAMIAERNGRLRLQAAPHLEGTLSLSAIPRPFDQLHLRPSIYCANNRVFFWTVPAADALRRTIPSSAQALVFFRSVTPGPICIELEKRASDRATIELVDDEKEQQPNAKGRI